MVKQRSIQPLSREHRAVWWGAFQIAWSAALGKDGDAVERSLTGLTRAAKQAAWHALDAYKEAAKGIRS